MTKSNWILKFARHSLPIDFARSTTVKLNKAFVMGLKIVWLKSRLIGMGFFPLFF